MAVDQQAALSPSGALRGRGQVHLRDRRVLARHDGAAAVGPAAGLSASVAWRLAGRPTYCLDGQVYTAGAALRWLTASGLLPGPRASTASRRPCPTPAASMFVPALAGLGAPQWRAARPRRFRPAAGDHRAHLVRAVIEGIAASVALLAGRDDRRHRRAARPLRVDGGLTRSRLLMQAQADLLQVPVLVCRSPDATALGVAALARLGAGAVRDPGCGRAAG